ncbi:MAG: hypothetical protein JO347_07660 [Candidatus Eremiobacteraeota bacterium]|nr:hypothetical protein [Candidatus Eremiobacteraeota bacterium]
MGTMVVMERYWLDVIRERNEAVRDEIARHRLAIALRPKPISVWRRFLGRIVVRVGRAIEGENRIDFGPHGELRFDHE